MATLKPIILGMLAEELYCLLSEHIIYFAKDQDVWSRAVQKKIGQLLVVVAEKELDDEVLKTLHKLSQDVSLLPQIGDQIEARSKLAAIFESVIFSLAAHFEAADRAAYDTGVFVTRISLCANATSVSEKMIDQTTFLIYSKELLRAGDALFHLVDLSKLNSELAVNVKALLALALSGKCFRETHELAEQIMASAGFSSRGPLAAKNSSENPN